MKTLLSLWAGKTTNATIKEFGLGSGSTWPGHIALQLNPQFIKSFLQNKDLKVVLVAGTNGKTTTTKILRHILENNGLRVFQNEEGANLVNGLATSLIRNSTKFGQIRYDVAIFEVDENNLSQVLTQIEPTAIVFLNLFRDQLDRYGEVHTIATKWQKALRSVPADTKLILNADDPEIRYLLKSTKGKTFYFSIPDNYFSKKEVTHDTDSTHCPKCGTKLKFSKIAYSHLGKYSCTQCGFTNENIKNTSDDSYPPILSGTYNLYNLQAAVKTAREVFNLSSTDIKKSLVTFTPAFGRQENIEYKKRNLLMLLSKNPAGFNQSLSAIQDLSMSRSNLDVGEPQSREADKNVKVRPRHGITVLLALNDRIPDGRDVSWIWDIDMDELTSSAKKIIVTGDRAYDMGLRLKYSFGIEDGKSKKENREFNQKVKLVPNPQQAVDELLKVTPEGETAFILPTYSAMLEIRKIITGKEIL